MKMRIMTITLMLAGLFSVGGCTSQQSQDLQTNLAESLKIKATVDKATVEANKVRADVTLSEVEKVSKQANIYTQAAIDTELIQPDQAEGFLAAIDTIAGTYMAWTPLGIPKANWLTLVILGYVAIRGKKTRGINPG
jgi:hypothetical protein